MWLITDFGKQITIIGLIRNKLEENLYIMLNTMEAYFMQILAYLSDVSSEFAMKSEEYLQTVFACLFFSFLGNHFI